MKRLVRDAHIDQIKESGRETLLEFPDSYTYDKIALENLETLIKKMKMSEHLEDFAELYDLVDALSENSRYSSNRIDAERKKHEIYKGKYKKKAVFNQ